MKVKKLLALGIVLFLTSCGVESISLDKNDLTLARGQGEEIKAKIKGEAFSPPSVFDQNDLSWTSSDEKIVSIIEVHPAGTRIIGRNLGTATITIKSKSFTDKSTDLRVTVKAASLKIVNNTSYDMDFVYWYTNALETNSRVSFGEDLVYDTILSNQQKGIRKNGGSSIRAFSNFVLPYDFYETMAACEIYFYLTTSGTRFKTYEKVVVGAVEDKVFTLKDDTLVTTHTGYFAPSLHPENSNTRKLSELVSGIQNNPNGKTPSPWP